MESGAAAASDVIERVSTDRVAQEGGPVELIFLPPHPFKMPTAGEGAARVWGGSPHIAEGDQDNAVVKAPYSYDSNYTNSTVRPTIILELLALNGVLNFCGT